MDSSINFIDVAALTQDEKNTQLLNAAEAGDMEKIGVLLQAGANIEAVSRFGETALMLAAANGHTAVVAQLISASANIEATDHFRKTALMMAAGSGHTAVVAQLIGAGANKEATNQLGSTALMVAAGSGHAAVVAKLIAANANIEATDQFGETALIRAARNGHTAVVAKLIEAGENIEATNQFGRTALDSAARNNHQDAGFLLLNSVSSERFDVLSCEPNLAPIIQSFRRTIARAKIDAIQTYMALFSHKEQQRIPLELMNPILDFVFPTWLSSREDLKVEEIPALKNLLNKMPTAVISAAAEESQAPVPVTFRPSASAAAE